MLELLTQAQAASSGAGGIVEDGLLHPHAEQAEQALRTAAALADLGVQRGDAVAIMLPAGVGDVVALPAASALGAAAMPLNLKYERTELSSLLGAAGVRALITDGGCAQKCCEALRALASEAPVAVTTELPRIGRALPAAAFERSVPSLWISRRSPLPSPLRSPSSARTTSAPSSSTPPARRGARR